MTVKVRAQSIIKISTGMSNLDHTYPKDAKVEHILKDMLHATLFNMGKTKCTEYINELLNNYEENWRDAEAEKSSEKNIAGV